MARDVARKAEIVLEEKAHSSFGLPGKLADCQIQKREERTFIVRETQLEVLLNKVE